jgi:hypothetical protein
MKQLLTALLVGISLTAFVQSNIVYDVVLKGSRGIENGE